MSVSSLREVTIGVADVQARRGQFESGLGLSVLASGAVTSTTAWRLFDLPAPVTAAVLGPSAWPEAPRVRLVESPGSAAARPQGLRGPGSVGIGFALRSLATVQARLQREDVRFFAPPLPRPATPSASAATPRKRLEAYGQTLDGDFLVLTEQLASDAAAGSMAARPGDASFIVTNLDACLHFMKDVLDQEASTVSEPAGAPFDSIFGVQPEARLRLARPRHETGTPAGVAFLEFEKRLAPPPQFPAFSRGLCRLRYDTTDLHATLARVPGGGGSLVRGPSGIDDPVLGRGLVALVRSPFGAVIELWQTA